MPPAKTPTYESLVADLNRSLKALLRKSTPDGRSAMAIASVARAMVLAMEKIRDRDHADEDDRKDPFAKMSRDELIEFARNIVGEEKDAPAKLKAVS